jgi:Tfp pilus assembly protein PilV
VRTLSECRHRPNPPIPGRDGVAFTLLEVLIAVSIFFIAMFAILDMTANSVKAARHLQRSNVDVGMLGAMMSLTNQVEEGPVPREIILPFEEANPEYACRGNITEVSSNGLFQVDFEIYSIKDKRVAASTLSMLLFRPPAGGAAAGRLGSTIPR